MVFSNAKRLKWIEQRLSCTSIPQSSPRAASAALGPAPACNAQPHQPPSPVLQSPPQPTAELQKGLNTMESVPLPAFQQASVQHVDTGTQQTDPPSSTAAQPAGPQPCLVKIASPAAHPTSAGTGFLPYRRNSCSHLKSDQCLKVTA